MNGIVPYLTFNGNCREAMTYYQSCIGGQLDIQTIGSAPLSDDLPDKMKDCVLLATLQSEYILFMGTDLTMETGLIKGNSVSLLLRCPTDEMLIKLLPRLSHSMKNLSPKLNNAGQLFAHAVDKYGIHWLLQSQGK